MSELSTTMETVVEEYHLPLFELIVAPITLSLFVVFAIVLLMMIVHLIHKTLANKSTTTLFFLIATITTVLSFEISLIVTIIVTVQLFLMDDVVKESTISSTFFFATYHTFQYLMAIFDSLGHLLSLLIFIARFDCAFKTQMFNPETQALIIRFMYVMLIILTMISFFIMFYIIPFETNPHTLLIWEIVWELCVESMIIFVLFLFMSRFCQLLKLVLPEHIKRRNKTEFTKTIITRINSECSTNPTPATHPTMTIDGMHVHKEQNSMERSTTGASTQTIQLLSLMSKLTVLVIVSAVGSFVTIIGNLLIETHGIFNEKNIASREHSHQEFDHDAIWVFVLPVLDMLLTSIMVYLQFGFTSKIYRKMCGCLDNVFLKCMLSVMFCCWATPDDTSFMVECNAPEMCTKTSVELHTASPTTSEFTYATRPHSQVPIQNVMR